MDLKRIWLPLALGLGLSVLLVSAELHCAYASDVKPEWQGFYAGVNAGWGGSTAKLRPGCIDNNGIVNGPFCQSVPSTRLTSSGLIGGGQLGYNHQRGELVFGFELDMQRAGISGSKSINGPFRFVNGGAPALTARFTARQQLQWFGTARLRLGRAIAGRTLVYGTGGLAFGRFHLQSDFVTVPTFTFPANKHVTRAGWTVGAGVEHALPSGHSLKLEGLYYNMGRKTLSAPCGPGCIPAASAYTRTTGFDLSGVIVRLGFNWALGESGK